MGAFKPAWWGCCECWLYFGSFDGILDYNHELLIVFGSRYFFVSAGVYLSKYSDLLQINPFEVGSYGDMIVFKVMRVRLKFCCHSPSCLISFPSQTSSSSLCVSQGRVKHIHENMPKNAIEPSPKFDSHLSKSASRVTSLLSYRAFELTQVNTGSLSLPVINLYLFVENILRSDVLPLCLAAIFFWVCVWWDQGPAQTRVSLRCGFLSVQRKGSYSSSDDCTQVDSVHGI